MLLEFPLGNPCPYPYPKTFFFHSFKVSGLNIKVFSQFWVEKQNERYRSNFIFQHVEWFYSCKYFWWLCKKKKGSCGTVEMAQLSSICLLAQGPIASIEPASNTKWAWWQS